MLYIEVNMTSQPIISTVSEWLNILLGHELTSINQYFFQYRLLEHKGVIKLAEIFKKESIEEMKHVDVIMKRIFFLDNIPKLTDLSAIGASQDIKKMLEKNLEMEVENVNKYQQAIFCAENQRDFGSADILHGILQEEEEHCDWLKKQLNIIKEIGIERYTQSLI